MGLFIFLPDFDNTASWWPAWVGKGQRMLFRVQIIIGTLSLLSRTSNTGTYSQTLPLTIARAENAYNLIRVKKLWNSVSIKKVPILKPALYL